MTTRSPYEPDRDPDRSEAEIEAESSSSAAREADGRSAPASPSLEAPADPDPGPSLARRAASGGMLMAAQTACSQVINLGGFILLGFLLTETDHGLFTQTITVATFATLLQQIGIRSILISRAERFAVLGAAATVLMLTGGLLLAAAIMGAAPLIARAYGSPQLVPLIQIIALSVPFNAVAVVAESRLQIDLRFRSMVRIQFTRLLGEMLAMIAMALLGAGPYALVVPRTVFTISATADYWRIARPHLGLGRDRRLPRLRRNMGRLLGDSRHLAPANVANYLISQSDRIILSIFATPAIVGIYGFALSLVSRPALVLDRSLASVLAPVLGRLRDEPERQARGYVRAVRLTAAISAPLCLQIGLAAAPVMHTIMHPRWLPTIPIMQLMAVTTVFAIVGRTHAPLLDMQRRFHIRMRLNIIHAVVMVSAVAFAAREGRALAVAQAVAVVQTIGALVKIRVAIGGGGLGWREVSSILTVPVLAGAAASAVTHAALTWIPNEGWGWWAQLPTIPLLFFPVYLVILRLFARETFAEFVGQARSVMARLERFRR
ncbi:MAG: oligosaccharide flippase family protein [Phycisphaerales bacterium]